MKKVISAVVILTVVMITTSFQSFRFAPKLYPELETYFRAIEAMKFKKDQLSTLENLRYNINSSDMDHLDWNCIFYCTENSFRSQASQVFLETLCYSKKHKKVKAYSAGINSGDINPQLITYLSKIGYKISKVAKAGKTVYEVRYSDNAAPILLFSKTITDNSLPTKEVTPVIVCNRLTEPICDNLKIEAKALELPFPNAGHTDSEVKIEATLKSIATAMQYVTEKRNVN